MRMRRKKNLIPRMERCADWQIQDPRAMRGRWRSLCPEAETLWLEIGCGKGTFTAEMARQHPEALLIAVERVPDALVMAMEKARTLELRNVFFICADAAELGEMFAPDEVDRIFINFCDPWPSKRHAKRRLTHAGFLRAYRAFLREGGEIHFKTDNRPLFDFSLTQFPEAGYTLSEVTYHLHEHGTQGVMTDYEAKFAAQGMPIHRCVAAKAALPEPIQEGSDSVSVSIQVSDLYSLEHTLAKPLLERFPYPWEALEEIGAFVHALGPTLDQEEYVEVSPAVWVARSAQVAATATLTAPCIIGPETEVRPGAFLRGNVLVGRGAVVGNSTELKNVILFDGVQVPHYNYVGDSILGYRAHMGAGSITSNVKSDKSPVVVKAPDGQRWETGRKKFGAMLGDRVEVGCNSVLNPGTVIGPESNIYPLSSVRGVVPARHIFKAPGNVVPKHD